MLLNRLILLPTRRHCSCYAKRTSRCQLPFGSLTDSDRLLVRLRYQEGLTLQQVARLVGLKDAQTADRRLRDIIDHLRQALGVEHFIRGKPKTASV
jgi:hypothetical protein